MSSNCTGNLGIYREGEEFSIHVKFIGGSINRDSRLLLGAELAVLSV